MKIRWFFPLAINAKGSSPEALSLGSKFTHADFSVNFMLNEENPANLDVPDKEKNHFRLIRGISFDVENKKIKKLEESDYPSLFMNLVPIINRVIRSIRNFGFIATAREINPRNFEAESYFRKWRIEICKDSVSWNPLLKKEPWEALLYAMFPKTNDELDASLWPDILESIKDNRVPAPEEEFIINTIEYLKERNYRMALVESVICLEIVTNQYLEKYLSIHMKIPKDRIEKLLQPQVGLSARVAVLLNLCLHPDDIKKIELNNTITAIRWRNKIMHKTGNLPDNLPENITLRNITSVLQLADLLARRRNQVEASPDMQEISKTISEKFKVPYPNIWVTGRHRILMEFVFFVFSNDIPAPEILEKISLEASRLLSERDPRFEPEEHLYIKYLNLAKKLLARWYDGKLHLVPSAKKENNH